MAWHEQPDHTGRDDAGHTCQPGVMHLLKTRRDLARANGLMAEVYTDRQTALLPLANGAFILSRQLADGTWTSVRDDAAGLDLLIEMYVEVEAKLAGYRIQIENTLTQTTIEAIGVLWKVLKASGRRG